MRYLLVIFGLFVSVSQAQAACTGSGLTWNCSAGSTTSELQSAINSSSNGATVTVAAGNYSWAGTVTLNKNGISLVCASIGACNVAVNNLLLTVNAVSATPYTNLIRISGFKFSGTAYQVIWIQGDVAVEKLRIDNNSFDLVSAANSGIYIGHTQAIRKVRGVIDHNTFTGSVEYRPMMIFGAGEYDWITGTQGSADNLFIESNTINFASHDVNAGNSCIDTWHGGSVVFRYNNIRNCRVSVHGVLHGGPANFEVYNNDIYTSAGYRLIHHQGSGEFMVFNNKLSHPHIALLYYRSDAESAQNGGVCDGTNSKDGNRAPTTTYKGYPCWRQPGRDAAANLRPVYVWNNFVGTSKVSLSLEGVGAANFKAFHFYHNRDYYEAPSASAQSSLASPFNGTSGMGFGTLANRPTTCTTGAEVGGGVGYFATDSNTLYRCASANTWVQHYKPYQYPHPLVDGIALPQPIISAPQNLAVI